MSLATASASRVCRKPGSIAGRLLAAQVVMISPQLAPIAAAADALPGRAPSPIVVLDDWGTYTGTSSKDVAASGSNSGKLTKVLGAETLLRTHLICAELGTMFGIKIGLEDGLPYQQLPVSIEVDHPALTNVHGQTQNRDSFDTILRAGEPGWRRWVFKDPLKLAPGKWTFIVRSSKTVLLTESFDVSFGCSKPVA